MKKSDIIAILIIGEIVAIFLILVLKNLGYFFSNLLWLLLPVLPIVAIVALFIFYLASKKFPFMFQLGKFAAVGFANAVVDFGVLNLLIFLTNITSGMLYSVFKAASVILALIHSYLWNKFWTFKQKETSNSGKEFFQFFIVSAVGFIINVGVASVVVNAIGVQWGASLKLWANIGAMAGSLIGLAWNFLGYKFMVFKK